MILPGHLAAPLLASRCIDIDRKAALVAGVMPDLIDKPLYYLLHATRWSRLPAHSLLFFAGTSLAALVAGWLWRRDLRWGAAWLAGYGLHLLCDVLPPEGALPWLWPWRDYASYVSQTRPWFLGGGPVPWVSLLAEAALVAAAAIVELRHRRAEAAQG